MHDGPRGTESVPILMYHVIQPAPAGAPFPGLYVPRADFSAQMHALAAAGYHAVTLNQVWDNWHDGTPLPPGKPIVISFDNGYASQYTAALPVLRSTGLGRRREPAAQRPGPSQGGLSRPADPRLLVHDGWELDTQGYQPRRPDHARRQRAALPGRGRAADPRALPRRTREWFCYPSGHYNATVIAAVKAAGFRGSTTVIPGWAAPPRTPTGCRACASSAGPRRRRCSRRSPGSAATHRAGPAYP